MNNQAFAILEFGALRALVLRLAQTEMARARIHALEPMDNLQDLRRALSAVDEMIELRQRGAHLSFEGVADPTESISRLKIAGTALEPLTILDLAHLCERAIDARAAIAAEHDLCPTLFEIVSALPKDLTKLTALLKKKILPNGELDDRASPKLAEIRREINNARSRITRALENLMRRSSEVVQEELVTIRNDRFVIPVRSDHQARIKGVTHGSSSSGATVFVEPLETIEANNELQSLREAEQREIAEILFALSEEIRRDLPAVERAAEAIAELDFINAKAAFAERFDCVVPEVIEPGADRGPHASPRGVVDAARSQNQFASRDALATTQGSDKDASQRTENTLEFIDARHPLLEESLCTGGAHVVPVSFKLDDAHTTMIISGANAGGKTVVLKTAGLLSLMALSGLPVLSCEARVPFYRSILADIGDHQSLAANLSTFTSHVANIASMIDLCEAPALVLLDEVGTGTDPEEGSALGVAVVDHFKQRGAHVLATTHYSGLKMYAANQSGVLTASVEFDEKTLQPTYRLLLGLAGSSSGLEIAQRFGISQEIIGKASDHVKESSRVAVEYLRRIKREAEEAETLRRALEEERVAVAEKFTGLDQQFEKRERARQAEFENQLAAVVRELENHSRELMAKIQDRAERLKVEREAQKRASELKREAQRATEAARQIARPDAAAQFAQLQGQEGGLPPQLRGVRVIRDGKQISKGNKPRTQTESMLSKRPPSVHESVPTGERTAQVGDRVRLRTFGSVGIVDHIKGDEADVRVGSLHMREKLENLEPISEKRGSQSGNTREALRQETQSTELHLHSREKLAAILQSTELNLIGKKTDEAVELTDKFLDEAFLNGLSEVRIIHGHGTGALRKAIAELLADHPHVAKFTAAPQNQGGSGATIAELKQ